MHLDRMTAFPLFLLFQQSSVKHLWYCSTSDTVKSRRSKHTPDILEYVDSSEERDSQSNVQWHLPKQLQSDTASCTITFERRGCLTKGEHPARDLHVPKIFEGQAKDFCPYEEVRERRILSKSGTWYSLQFLKGHLNFREVAIWVWV